MKVNDFIVDELVKFGVTDAFGIPGGVILKLLNAMQNSNGRIVPHLCYHEQAAGFAACGYAQAKGSIGVAYATRGPGILNMITCIAEAYQESLPVLFITAHGNRTTSNARFDQAQELDVVSMVDNITKYAADVNSVEEVAEKIKTACYEAMSGRKGPVLLDFSASLFAEEIESDFIYSTANENNFNAYEIAADLKKSVHPVLLIGDGLRHTADKDKLFCYVEKLGIPVLSSRGSQDLLCGSPYYFGYIGSHGIRYSNFILAKADCILALGNRLAFPLKSESFAPVVKNKTIIRVDIDSNEFSKKIESSKTFCCDAGLLLGKIAELSPVKNNDSWLKICNDLKNELSETDFTEPVRKLVRFLSCQPKNSVYVSDIGNNEFWLSRAFEYLGEKGTVLCSKTFGTLGCALGKAIGAYYAEKKPVICVVGDQGFQYNLQELQYISKHHLPVKIVVINNCASGMIKDHENKILGTEIHVTEESGYYSADISAIAGAYGLDYYKFDEAARYDTDAYGVYEIDVPAIELTPNLPKGNPMQDMVPLLDRELYSRLNRM